LREDGIISLNGMSTQTRRYELKERAEAQERTRKAIAKAAAELHAEIGPAQTTVAEIARRAGVSRLTVYKHFPDNAALYPACSAHWMTEHPLPDFNTALSVKDPVKRVRAVLDAVYAGWYREWRGMLRNLQRDRGADAALDKMMSERSDASLDGFAAALAAGFALRGRRAERLRALIRVSLEFWTWERLVREGWDDDEAAGLMTDAISAAARTGSKGLAAAS
jgi:AcrR family transcriptional regulator